MKSIYYFIVAFFSLIVLGCSSTYTSSDFSSKQKFYDDFNNFAASKSLDVELTNDSSISVSNGFILDDTLYTPGFRINRKSGRIAVADIKKINYSGSDYKSANLLLKNGSQIFVEEINIANDTLNYTNSKRIITKDAVIPLAKLKKASYKNRWFSTPFGFLGGAIIGGFIGSRIPIYQNTPDGKPGREREYLVPTLIGSGTGAIIGSVVAWLIGYNYTYQFNP